MWYSVFCLSCSLLYFPFLNPTHSAPQIYKNFGLGSSYSSVMKFDCLLTYSEYGAAGRDLPDISAHLEEDIFQVPRRCWLKSALFSTADRNWCLDERTELPKANVRYSIAHKGAKDHTRITAFLYPMKSILRLRSILMWPDIPKLLRLSELTMRLNNRNFNRILIASLIF